MPEFTAQERVQEAIAQTTALTMRLAVVQRELAIAQYALSQGADPVEPLKSALRAIDETDEVLVSMHVNTRVALKNVKRDG